MLPQIARLDRLTSGNDSSEARTEKELIIAAACTQTAGVDGFRSLLGQGPEPLPDVDAFERLCSLRARSALDGVSWVQSG